MGRKATGPDGIAGLLNSESGRPDYRGFIEFVIRFFVLESYDGSGDPQEGMAI